LRSQDLVLYIDRFVATRLHEQNFLKMRTFLLAAAAAACAVALPSVEKRALPSSFSWTSSGVLVSFNQKRFRLDHKDD